MTAAEKDALPSNAPTPARLKLAEDIAARLGVDLPDAAMEDWRACADFITKNRAAIDEPPSDNKLGLAESLAQRMGVELPQEARVSWRACNAFIDGNIASAPPPAGVTPKAPSEKQIAFVERLATEKGIQPPANYRESSWACSKFIDAHAVKKTDQGAPAPRRAARAG